MALSFAAITPALATTDPCNFYPDVPVNVTPRFDDEVYDYSYNLAALQTLSNDTRHAVHGSHAGLTLGLTRYEPMMEFAAPIKITRRYDGLACAQVDHVDVTFGYRNVTVYVPDEIPQGSCGFDQVIAHERKHIAVNRAILDEYSSKLVDQIKDYLRLNGVFREQNPDYAVAEVKEKLQSILDDTASEIFTENSRRQHDVDSPEEYRRVGASCNGQLISVATQYRRTGK